MALSSKPFSWAFTLLAIVVVAVCVLMVVPRTWAQEAPCSGGACLDITLSPNPVNVGQPLTFTITASCAPGPACSSRNSSGLTDTLPPGVTYVSATASGAQPANCTESAGIVRCAPEAYTDTTPFVETISVIPMQCGTFSNTANGAADLTASATFTVVGCPTPTSGAAGATPAAAPSTTNISPSYSDGHSG